MLRVVSYNCNSIRSKIDVIRELMVDHDIVLIQELLLLEEDIGILDDIHHDFNYTACLKDKMNFGVNCGRPSKGVCIFWRKSIANCIDPVKFDERIIAININTLNAGRILLLNVYMPCNMQDLESLHLYRSYIGVLESILNDSDVSEVLIAGDFNADPSKGKFWKEVSEFIDRNCLKHFINNVIVNDFSYLCPAKSTVSLLDHVISSQHIFKRLSSLKIIHDMCLFDHFPVHFEIDVELPIITDFKETYTENEPSINWNSINDSQICQFKQCIEADIKNSNIFQIDVLNCFNENCSCVNHSSQLDYIYNFILQILLIASSIFYTKKLQKSAYLVGTDT